MLSVNTFKFWLIEIVIEFIGTQLWVN